MGLPFPDHAPAHSDSSDRQTILLTLGRQI